MGTIISKPGGGGTQVGYKGFKYKVRSVYYQPAYDPPSSMVPGDGEILLFQNSDGEGGYTYDSMRISRVSADGVLLGDILGEIGNQPLTVIALNGTTIILPIASAAISYVNSPIIPYYVAIDASANLFQPLIQTVDYYFNFAPSNIVPLYSGYAMAGNLNGTTIPVGTSYLGIGSSTAGATITSRSFYTASPQAWMRGAFITTAGVMTGSMSLKVIANGGYNVNTPYTIPAGSSAGSYQFVTGRPLQYTDINTLVIEVTQSTATSCGILGFSVIVA